MELGVSGLSQPTLGFSTGNELTTIIKLIKILSISEKTKLLQLLQLNPDFMICGRTSRALSRKNAQKHKDLAIN